MASPLAGGTTRRWGPGREESDTERWIKYRQEDQETEQNVSKQESHTKKLNHRTRDGTQSPERDVRRDDGKDERARSEGRDQDN